MNNHEIRSSMLHDLYNRLFDIFVATGFWAKALEIGENMSHYMPLGGRDGVGGWWLDVPENKEHWDRETKQHAQGIIYKTIREHLLDKHFDELLIIYQEGWSNEKLNWAYETLMNEISNSVFAMEDE